jgi:ATP-dependent protease ClpP protease subunit
MAPRDRWMTADELLKLGFVDEIQKIDWKKK